VNSEHNMIRLHTAPLVPLGATRGADSLESGAEIVRLSQGSRRVWTVRMLEALARGNGGRQWHTLIDKVWSPQALETAVKLRSLLRHREKREGRAKGRDHQRYPNAHFIRAGLTFLITVTHPDPPAPRRT
jgi:hypothetical protein